MTATPAYYRNSDQFFLDSYTGTGGYLWGGYLEQFPSETADNYAARQRASVYPNFVGKMVRTQSGFLWKRAPSRETGDLYAAFAANADGAGTALDMILQNYQVLAMVLGTVYVIVDKPNFQARSRAEERMPYLCLRLPGECLNPVLDGQGRLLSGTFSEVCEGQTRYRHFDAEGWRVTKDSAGVEIIEQGSYRFGRPPVARLHSTMPLLPGDVRAQGWAHDLIQINWDLYNQASELRDLFRAQTFAQLALPAADQNERERLANMTMGAHNALTFDPANGGKPFYFAPPPDPIAQYQDNIARTIDLIYKFANLEFVQNAKSGRSGVSLSFDFEQANAGMAAMAALCERAEREIAEFVSGWMGQTFAGNISYPRDFNLVDLAEELKQGIEAVDLQISPTFDSELKKRLARRVLGHGVPAATMEQIDNEIENGADPYGDRMKKEAGNLPPIATGAKA
jgi:hypothetical protein